MTRGVWSHIRFVVLLTMLGASSAYCGWYVMAVWIDGLMA